MPDKEEPEQFTRELREMAERTEALRVETGKWIGRVHRGVEIRRLPPTGAQRPGGVGGVGAGEGAADGALAADLILLALEDLGEAYPKEIAEATGLSPKTVTNNLPELKRRVKICYTGRTGPGGAKQVALIPALRPKRNLPGVGLGPKGNGPSYFGELKE